ncbi:hypothetical protein PHLGIDRAFT_239037 [Phlebiopsis gigantea 11061_1 CR5-6]|uniref:MYND-type domain-containing protein n=1 Tax=Phlebiopsis gigantea (strain 11061_1 CR5-6) TaxID=745531 RepID=A0A0C3S5C0_PHLG1|nr:hypothetical protein PHLGIDRAFT_239037 [Phlebiopsis gigantea 11061_1 CR5-6]
MPLPDLPQVLPDDPSQWGQLFVQGYRSRLDCISENTQDYDSARSLLWSIVSRVTDADQTTMETLWLSGMFVHLARIITDQYFCGCTKEELEDPSKATVIQDNIICLLQAFQPFLDKLGIVDRDDLLLANDPHDGVYIEALTILATEFNQIGANLWEFRTTLLEPTIDTMNDNDTFYVQTIALVSSVAHLSALHILVSFDILKKPRSRVRQLLLLGWAYSKVSATRKQLLHSFIALCYEFDAPPCRRMSSIVRDVYANDEWFETVLKSLIRALTDSTCLDQELNSVSLMASTLAPAMVWMDGDPPLRMVPLSLDQRVAWALFSATRRQLCMGAANVSYGNATWIAALYFNGTYCNGVDPKTVSPWVEIRIHALIEQIAARLIPALVPRSTSDGMAPEFAQWPAQIIQWCEIALQHAYPSQAGPRRRFLRQRSWKVWKASIPHLTAMGYVNAYGGCSNDEATIKAWLHLRLVLSAIEGPARTPEVDYPFAPLERCRWAGCLCHVHKPAHPMKMCKGCWNVAYCGEKCRESDWPNHRDVCPGRVRVSQS